MAVVQQKEDCGCTLSSTPPTNDPLSDADTHAEIVVNTNYKYTIQTIQNSFSVSLFMSSYNYSLFHSPHNARLYSSNIFHPPLS